MADERERDENQSNETEGRNPQETTGQQGQEGKQSESGMQGAQTGGQGATGQACTCSAWCNGNPVLMTKAHDGANLLGTFRLNDHIG